MQKYFLLVCLLLACAVVLIHARNHGNDFVERADDVNERERSILQFNRNLRKFPSLNPRLFNYIINEDYIPSEQERLPTPARRAQAIVKGDPREFMG